MMHIDFRLMSSAAVLLYGVFISQLVRNRPLEKLAVLPWPAVALAGSILLGPLPHPRFICINSLVVWTKTWMMGDTYDNNSQLLMLIVSSIFFWGGGIQAKIDISGLWHFSKPAVLERLCGL